MAVRRSRRRTNAQRRTGRGPESRTRPAWPGALVSGAAAQAVLHECLAAGALQPLGRRVRVAGLHFLLLAVARRGGRRRRGARGRRRALLRQAALHEGLAVGALQSLGRRVRVAARHLLPLAVLTPGPADGL